VGCLGPEVLHSSGLSPIFITGHLFISAEYRSSRSLLRPLRQAWQLRPAVACGLGVRIELSRLTQAMALAMIYPQPEQGKQRAPESRRLLSTAHYGSRSGMVTVKPGVSMGRASWGERNRDP
jgi:hypothetical protein